MALSLSVRGAARAAVPVAERRRLRRRFQRAMRAAGVAEADLCLSLTDDAELRALHCRYAGEDRPTDVLSFAQALGFPTAADLLGDIVISVETAGRQACAAGHDLGDELLLLAVHGLCHLLGYDHATPEEARRMFGYEAQLRAESRRSGPLRPRPRPPR